MRNNDDNQPIGLAVAYDPIWAGVISLIGSLIPIIGFIPWLVGTLVGFIGGNKYEHVTHDKSTAKKLVKIALCITATYIILFFSAFAYYHSTHKNLYGSNTSYTNTKSNNDQQAVDILNGFATGGDLLNQDAQNKLQQLSDLCDDHTNTTSIDATHETVTHELRSKQNSTKIVYTFKVEITRDPNNTNSIVTETLTDKNRGVD